MAYKTLISRNSDSARMRLVSFPEDTLAFFYLGREESGSLDKECITYSLVQIGDGWVLRTIGSKTPNYVDDKALGSTEKKNAWMEGFLTIADDVAGLEDSLPIRPQDAEDIRKALVRYHKEIYP